MDNWAFSRAVYTTLNDGGKLFGTSPDGQRLGRGHYAGQNSGERDAHDALTYLFILAREGRT
jgi:hypothetical protein